MVSARPERGARGRTQGNFQGRISQKQLKGCREAIKLEVKVVYMPRLGEHRAVFRFRYFGPSANPKKGGAGCCWRLLTSGVWAHHFTTASHKDTCCTSIHLSS